MPYERTSVINETPDGAFIYAQTDEAADAHHTDTTDIPICCDENMPAGPTREEHDMILTASDNLVTEAAAWHLVRQYLRDIHTSQAFGLTITRGHASRAEVTQRADALYGPGTWLLISDLTHEWWIPTLHTDDCWSWRFEGTPAEPELDAHGNIAVVVDDCGCDARDYIDSDGDHIVWREATKGAPGAVPVTLFQADTAPELTYDTPSTTPFPAQPISRQMGTTA